MDTKRRDLLRAVAFAAASGSAPSISMAGNRPSKQGLSGILLLPTAGSNAPNSFAEKVDVVTGERQALSATKRATDEGWNYHHAAKTTHGILVARQDGDDIQKVESNGALKLPSGLILGGHLVQRPSDGLVYAAANIITRKAKTHSISGMERVDSWDWLEPVDGKIAGIGCVLAIDMEQGEIAKLIPSAGTQTHDIHLHDGKVYVNHYGVSRVRDKVQVRYEGWYGRNGREEYDIVRNPSISVIDPDFGAIVDQHTFPVSSGACNHFTPVEGGVVANFFDHFKSDTFPARKDLSSKSRTFEEAVAAQEDQIDHYVDGLKEWMEEIRAAGVRLMPKEANTGIVSKAMPVVMDVGGDRHVIEPDATAMRRQQSICRDPMTGRVFQTNSGSGTITMIDAGRLKFRHINTRDWGVDEPRGIAFDEKGNGAVVDKRHGIAFFDTTTFEQVHYLDIDIANGVHATWIT